MLDLRGDAEGDSRANAELAGLHYINLPLTPRQYPQADAALRFLEIVNNQANWPVFVHCAGGRHRTGAMIAVYRMTMDQWTPDHALNEMKQYGFYTFGGHGCYKDYVYDCSRRLLQQQTKRIDALPETQPEKQAGLPLIHKFGLAFKNQKVHTVFVGTHVRLSGVIRVRIERERLSDRRHVRQLVNTELGSRSAHILVYDLYLHEITLLAQCHASVECQDGCRFTFLHNSRYLLPFGRLPVHV